MTVALIGPEAEARLDWLALTDALKAGHRLPRAEVRDIFLYRGQDTVLNRAAWIDGLGQLVKTATIFPGNRAAGKPAINGAASLFSDVDGTLSAMVDFHLLTKWKTAGDSLLAARHLARPDSREVLIVGAGTLARAVREAYGALFPQARFRVWNRTASGAEALAAAYPATQAVEDLRESASTADIVVCATMATAPLLQGDWLRDGTHVDLIGAYRPDMREADDATLTRGRLFVDSRDTTLGHIGEIEIPRAAGVISEADILGDFYDLDAGGFARQDAREITVFKNGGGAHLDLICADYIFRAQNPDP